MAHPYKGVPRAEWPKAAAAKKTAEAGLNQATSELVDAMTTSTKSPYDVPRETSPVAAPTPPQPSAPPRNLFSGDIKKLEVFGKNGDNKDPIPGYRLHWFLDRDGTGSRMFMAKQSGWEFVLSDEVALNDNGNLDMGTQVKVYGGANPNGGGAVYHWLMKKPGWLDAEHQKDMQKVPDRIEQELRRGTLGKTQDDGRYTAMPGSSLPEIKISSTR